MRINIGDVVRVRGDQVLGTVVSITGNGTVLHLHTDGQGSRVVSPHAVERVTQAHEPLHPGRAVVTVLLIIVVVVVVLVGSSRLPGIGAESAICAVLALVASSALRRLLNGRLCAVRV
ncbi:hypothetical protein [Streptomyces avicenniae]|uniref:hypothetical protein n=1 Tax=Streptomyces avicenniae TaxID=500153 RepID=UPI00069BAE3C|nr:hypothetical protein [Streptomyces avicenniae]